MSDRRSHPEVNDRDLVPPTIASGAGGSPDSSGDDLVGTTLAGRYKILRRLGEGAMGNVYLGEHLKIGRQDAIKVLRDDLAGDRDAIARFLRGTRNVSAIRHPNVCTIYDYSDAEGGLQFVAMEFVPGETLKDLLQRVGVLPIGRAVEIASQAAQALDAAHSAGVVHRDLKPANIMIMQSRSGADVVKVVDFDIAKGRADGEEEEVTRLGFVIGTPEYMSPEQLVGESLDGRSDIYSLALVLFRMLTGRLPFDAEGAQEVMIKRLTERPLLLAEARQGVQFPEALERALHRALSRKPQDRQSTADEFGRQITAAVADLMGDDREEATPIAAVDPRSSVPETEYRPGALAEKPIPAMLRGLRKKWVGRAAAAIGAMILSAAGGLMALGGGDVDEGARPEQIAAGGAVPAGADTEASNALASGDSGQVAIPEPRGGGSGGVGDGSPEPLRDPQSPPAAPPQEPAPAARPDVTLAAAEETLWRLFDRVGQNPTGTALVAARDTARIVWDLPDASADQRAFAAYIVGSALLPLGDTVGAVDWLQRAVDLRPDGPGYRQLLESYRQLLSR